MFKIIVLKELKSILLSPKFPATFGVCSLLLLLSVYIGINEYHASVKRYETAGDLAEQQAREARSWHQLSNRIYRAPNPMQVFVSGVSNDIGRTSVIDPTEQVKLTSSVYSDEPVYAVFRFIDFSFIVQVVFSLFAILFTYDSVNGERESGTLQLTFANALPRVQYVVGKVVGSWLGLVVPLSIPILLSILLVIAYGIPLTTQHWFAVAALVGISLLYFTFFIAFGTFVSSMAKMSSVSFLFSLVAWIVMTFIIPRAGAMAAGTLHPVPSVAEVESQRDAFAKQAWTRHRQKMEERFHAREQELRNKTKQDREAYNEEHQWQWMEQEDNARKEIMKDIDKYGAQLEADSRNGRKEQERLALTLSRFSPASVYQLASMTLAGSNIDLKTTFEDALNTYRTTFISYKQRKEKESGDTGGIRISVDSEKGFSFQMGRESGSLNVSDMPRFVASLFSFPEVLTSALMDVVLLLLFTVLAIAGTFIAFLRYDVR